MKHLFRNKNLETQAMELNNLANKVKSIEKKIDDNNIILKNILITLREAKTTLNQIKSSHAFKN